MGNLRLEPLCSQANFATQFNKETAIVRIVLLELKPNMTNISVKQKDVGTFQDQFAVTLPSENSNNEEKESN